MFLFFDKLYGIRRAWLKRKLFTRQNCFENLAFPLFKTFAQRIVKEKLKNNSNSPTVLYTSTKCLLFLTCPQKKNYLNKIEFASHRSIRKTKLNLLLCQTPEKNFPKTSCKLHLIIVFFETIQVLLLSVSFVDQK